MDYGGYGGNFGGVQKMTDTARFVLGIIGIIVFLAYITSLFIRHPKGFSRRDLNMQIYLILFIGINLFYVESLRDPFFCIIVYGFVALSWLPDKTETQEVALAAQG